MTSIEANSNMLHSIRAQMFNFFLSFLALACVIVSKATKVLENEGSVYQRILYVAFYCTVSSFLK